ncbi:MAG: hypothetical protein KIT58_11650 [Planctomycetota bacterium]|nr:hypothetical protein [Planctomycetota bacterium]
MRTGVEVINVELSVDPDLLRDLTRAAAAARRTVDQEIADRMRRLWQETNPCAVRGCEETGVAHRCHYCRWQHHHGRVHYDRAGPTHGLELRDDGWYLVCDTHYRALVEAHEQHLGSGA